MKKMIGLIFLFITLITFTQNDNKKEYRYYKYKKGEIKEIVVFPYDKIEADKKLKEIQKIEENMRWNKNGISLSKALKYHDEKITEYLEFIEFHEETIFKLGDMYFLARKYKIAGDIFSSNLESARNIFGAATSYRFAREFKTAIDFYNVVIDVDETMAEAYLGRGLAYKSLNENDKAIRDISTYIRMSTAIDGYVALADIYMVQKNINSAKRVLQAAIKQYPESELLKTMLKSAYSK